MWIWKSNGTYSGKQEWGVDELDSVAIRAEMKNAPRKMVTTRSKMTRRWSCNVKELPIAQVRTKNCFVRESIFNIT